MNQKKKKVCISEMYVEKKYTHHKYMYELCLVDDYVWKIAAFFSQKD